MCRWRSFGGTAPPRAGPGKLKLLAATCRSVHAVAEPADIVEGHRRGRGRRPGGPIAPAGTDAAVLARISQGGRRAVLAEPALVDKLEAQFMVPIANSPDEFRAVLKQEHDRWAPIIAAGGIKAE